MTTEEPDRGSIIIPAHNEAALIALTLRPLLALAASGTELIVVTNGCSDDTAARAGALPGVRVVELDRAGKAAALNAGDAVATQWPRLYLDADIATSANAVRTLFAELRAGGALAARPASRYDTTRSAPLVAAYYRARGRMPGMTSHLWGAGAYALTKAGHARLGRFPDRVADDLYVDALFGPGEVCLAHNEPVVIRCPRTTRALLGILRRVYGGRREVLAERPVAAVGGLRPLLAGVHRPAHLLDALVYAVLVGLRRFRPARRVESWDRDETSRAPEPVLR